MNIRKVTKAELEKTLNRLIKHNNGNCCWAKYIKHQLKRR